MKQIIIAVAVLITTLGYGQTSAGTQKDSTQVFQMQSTKVAFKTHSAEEVEKAFHPGSIQESLNDLDLGETFVFSIQCFKANSETDLKLEVSYRSSGNTSEIETWMTRLAKIKKIALNFYKNQ